jgi:hypothetical protein
VESVVNSVDFGMRLMLSQPVGQQESILFGEDFELDLGPAGCAAEVVC